MKANHNQYDSNPDKDSVDFVVSSIRNEPERVWTSTELHDIYIERGGTESHISQFITKIVDQLENKLYIFKAEGISSIIMYRDKASKMFNIVLMSPELMYI